jgi:signal peptidase I
MKPTFKLVGIIIVLWMMRLALFSSPTVASYDTLLLFVGLSAIGLLLFYEMTQESTKLIEVGQQLFQMLYPSFVFFAVLYLTINVLIFPARVNGTSMVPTYLSGDFVVFWMPITPQRSDVVFVNITTQRTNHFTDEFMLKRIIGVAGDTIDIDQGRLILNGDIVTESYITSPMQTMSLPCFSDVNCRTVPPGMVFVMGDNRNFSIDSRSYGLVPESDIIGRVILNLREVW